MWKNKNIWTIHNIVDEQGSFLPIEVLRQTYDTNFNMLQYNALKDAVPAKWRQILKKMNIPKLTINQNDLYSININKQQIPIHKVTNKLLYWALIKEKQTVPIIKDKWNTEFGLNDKDWEQIFLISRVINDTKIRVFQYKLLFNLIPCNLYLFRIKKSDTYNCQSCNVTDNVTHYIYSCNEVIQFWNSFERWWKNMTDEMIIIDKKTVILGDIAKKNSNTRLNACILLAKWFIYVEKLNNNKIFFYKFLCHLKYKIRIEKITFTRTDKIHKYLELWGQIEDFIT